MTPLANITGGSGQVLADGNSIVQGLQSGWGGLIALVIILFAVGSLFKQSGGVKQAGIVLLGGAILMALLYSPLILRQFGEGFTGWFS